MDDADHLLLMAVARGVQRLLVEERSRQCKYPNVARSLQAAIEDIEEALTQTAKE